HLALRSLHDALPISWSSLNVDRRPPDSHHSAGQGFFAARLPTSHGTRFVAMPAGALLVDPGAIISWRRRKRTDIRRPGDPVRFRSEEHTSELQSRFD